MGDYSSNSYDDGGMQMERYYGSRRTSSNPHDFRSYSASSYAYSYPPPPPPIRKEMKLKKGKSVSGSSKSWGFTDPEFQRKKRVASYKVYSVEGKVKGSFSKSFRWLKGRYTRMVHGWF